LRASGAVAFGAEGYSDTAVTPAVFAPYRHLVWGQGLYPPAGWPGYYGTHRRSNPYMALYGAEGYSDTMATPAVFAPSRHLVWGQGLYPPAGWPGYYGTHRRFLTPYGPGGFGFGDFFSDAFNVIAAPFVAPVQLAMGKTPDIVGTMGTIVDSAGKEIGAAWDALSDVMGQVGSALGQIPIIGGILDTLFSAGWDLATAPMQLTVDIAIKGQSIDQAVLQDFKKTLADFKEIAPYAQMVLSFIPGIGTVASAALAAGLALAEGQSVGDALAAGLIGALPGGPAVKAAATMGYQVLSDVATGKQVNFESIAQTAGGIVGSYFAIPAAAVSAISGGIGVAAGIVAGKPIDRAIARGAIDMLDTTKEIKGAMSAAADTAIGLFHGRPWDQIAQNDVNEIIGGLSDDHQLKKAIKAGMATALDLAHGAPPGAVMATAIHNGLADAIVGQAAAGLPDDVRGALQTGIGVGTGLVHQGRKVPEIVAATGKLVQSGVELAQAHPVVQAARALLPGPARRGFDAGSGLMQQRAKTFDVQVVRQSLSPQEQTGFDTAVATRVGMVVHPKPAGVSPAAAAGYAITKGMQGGTPSVKQAVMANVSKQPQAAAGATAAVKEVAAGRQKAGM